MFEVASLPCKQVRTGHKASLNLGQGVAEWRCVGCDSDANSAADCDSEWRLRWPRRWRRRWRLPAHTCAGHMCEGRRTVRGRVRIQLKLLPDNWGGQLGGIGQCWLSCVHSLGGSGKWRSHGQWRMANGVRWALGSRVWGRRYRSTRSHSLTFSLFPAHAHVWKHSWVFLRTHMCDEWEAALLATPFFWEN